MAYTLVNVMKPAGGNPGAKGGLNPELILIDKNDVASFPAWNADYSALTGDIGMVAGKTMHIFEVTNKTLDFKHTLTGEDDARSWDIMVEAERPGQEGALDAFLNNNVNTDFYVIIRQCTNNTMKLCGTPCCPMKLDTAESGFREGNKTKITLKVTDSPYRAAIYTGALEIEGDSGSGSGSSL